MALLQPKSHSLPHSEERRRHQRVRVNLHGRYMLADRSEFPCQVVNRSPGGMALIAPGSGNVGDRVIAYVDHLGRLEGKIARQLQNGFAMTIAATPRKRDKLAAQLTWLANRSVRRSAASSRLARSRAAWCVTSKKASRWSSPGFSTRTPSKKTPPRSKRKLSDNAQLAVVSRRRRRLHAGPAHHLPT